jgi:hypothetical protein
MVFYVRDPGAGFRRESLTNAAIANPADDPTAHIVQREAEGLHPGGYGLPLVSGTVGELIDNDIGNEVLLIKYVDGRVPANLEPSGEHVYTFSSGRCSQRLHVHSGATAETCV